MSERYLKITAAGQIHIKNIDTNEEDKNFLERFMANSKNPLSVNQLSKILNLSLDDTLKLVESYVSRNFIRDTIAPLNQENTNPERHHVQSLQPTIQDNREENNNSRLSEQRSYEQRSTGSNSSILNDHSQKQVIIIKHIPVPVTGDQNRNVKFPSNQSPSTSTNELVPAYDTTPIDVTDEAREKSFDEFMRLFGQKK